MIIFGDLRTREHVHVDYEELNICINVCLAILNQYLI